MLLLNRCKLESSEHLVEFGKDTKGLYGIGVETLMVLTFNGPPETVEQESHRKRVLVFIVAPRMAFLGEYYNLVLWIALQLLKLGIKITRNEYSVEIQYLVESYVL